MHGRVKKLEFSAPSEAENQLIKEKIRKGKALIQLLLNSKKEYDAQTFDEGRFPNVETSRKEMLKMTFKLLEFHPEFGTIWNYRRLLLEDEIVNNAAEGLKNSTESEKQEDNSRDESSKQQLPENESLLNIQGKPVDEIEAWLQEELSLLQRSLRKAPKSYCVWHHRKWTIRKLLKHYRDTRRRSDNNNKDNIIEERISNNFQVTLKQKLLNNMNSIDSCKLPDFQTSAAILLRNELQLCGEVFHSDDRNFHCWTYRQEILNDLNLPEHNNLAECVIKSLLHDVEAQRWEANMKEYDFLRSSPSSIGLEFSVTNFSQCNLNPKISLPCIFTEKANLGWLLIHYYEELFSRSLIEKNFSNFSAWHLRSKLFFMGDDENDTSLGLIDPKKELEWVRQGIYTEPRDESVWQYYYWLINSKLRQSIPDKLGLIAVRIMRHPKRKILLYFSRPTALEALDRVYWKPFHTSFDSITGKNLAIRHHPQRLNRRSQAFVWVAEIDDLLTPFILPFTIHDPPKLTPTLSQTPTKNSVKCVLFVKYDNSSPSLEIVESTHWDVVPWKGGSKTENSKELKFSDSIQSDVNLLTDELAQCEELIELENGNCKHALVHLYRLLLDLEQLSERSSENQYLKRRTDTQNKVEKTLLELMAVDPTRKTLYVDLLERERFRTSPIIDNAVDLSSKFFCRLPPLGHLTWPRFISISKLNLSNNNLTSRSFSECGLGLLINLSYLDLSSNQITSLKFIFSMILMANDLSRSSQNNEHRIIDLSYNPLHGDNFDKSDESTSKSCLVLADDDNRRMKWLIKIAHTPLAAQLERGLNLPSYLHGCKYIVQNN